MRYWMEIWERCSISLLTLVVGICKINEVFDGGIMDGLGCGLFMGNLNDVCG